MTNWPLEHDPIFGCQLWTSKLDRDGYGVSWRGRQATKAHIAVWVEARGLVREGFELEHSCRRRRCCALHHLEEVTRSENEKLKSWRYRSRRTKCLHGHDLKLNGVVTPEGGRVCRSCNREALS